MRSLPRGCKIVEEDTGTKNSFAFRAVCTDQRSSPGWPKDFVGRIKAHRSKLRGRVVYAVGGISVDPLLQRRGIGTLLYEAAAREACRRRGRLASTERNTDAHSNDFWQKQESKGRAKRLHDPGVATWAQPVVLNNCDEPIDLSGLSPSTTPWLLGGAVALAALLFSSKASAAIMPNPFSSEDDITSLARMLIAETGFTRDKNEMAQIVFVALNRSKKYKATLKAVVVPPGKPVWNGSDAYESRFDGASSNPRFEAAKAFVRSVLGGAYTNSGATSFVHPSGMPTPPCSSNRVATQTASGSRCLPEWAVGGRVIGGAMFV